MSARVFGADGASGLAFHCQVPEELKIKTISLEDKLIECASEEIIDISKQKTFLYSMHEDVMDIIKLINKNYHNF